MNRLSKQGYTPQEAKLMSQRAYLKAAEHNPPVAKSPVAMSNLKSGLANDKKNWLKILQGKEQVY